MAGGICVVACFGKMIRQLARPQVVEWTRSSSYSVRQPLAGGPWRRFGAVVPRLFARVSWARTRMAGFALSGVCLEAGRNRRLAWRHHGQTQRGRVVCGRLALPSTFTPARLRRGSRLRWRRSVRRRPAERTVRQLPQQQARQRDAQRGNRVWVMPLRTDPATRAGGSLPPALRQRIQDDRRGQRGKNGSARPPGTHKPQCTA